MQVYTVGTFNARGGPFKGDSVTLQAIPKTAGDQLIGFKQEYRLGSVHFESNCLGGNYICGKNILHTQPGSERLTGGKGVPLTVPKWLVSDTLQGLLSDAGDQIVE